MQNKLNTFFSKYIIDKNIVFLSIMLGFIFTVFSLNILEVDYSDYYEYNYTKNKDFNIYRENEYYFFYNKTVLKEGQHCDTICQVYQGFPLRMGTKSPIEHYDMRWDEKNIFYNFVFYFIIVFISLIINNFYVKIYFKK